MGFPLKMDFPIKMSCQLKLGLPLKMGFTVYGKSAPPRRKRKPTNHTTPYVHGRGMCDLIKYYSGTNNEMLRPHTHTRYFSSK